jgi:diaminohydroxyphosphoribosylaminopyrimidine deaminase/5-amino-6-(5-phosphoribosylamino)uracil reductase
VQVSVEQALAHAAALGRAGLGTTSPNPSVGCVLLAPGGDIVGAGATEPPPGRHAEVVALDAAGEAARGATAVVTLEPCSHTGRTGPCTEALLAAGVARVVYAAADPDPLAAGGAATLAAAGVEMLHAGEEYADYLRPWLTAVRLGRPYVTWKTATTLDGRVAAPDGSSRWITGPAARADVHELRGRVDAVVVGVGTVLADDPQLTVRDEDGMPAGRRPLRVVMDTSGRTPAEARVRDDAAPTLVLTGRHTPAEALEELHTRGVRHVLLEGGPTLSGAFVRAGVVDEVVAYLAPALLGAGPASITLPAGSIGDARRLELVGAERVGDDVRVTARFEVEGR